MNELQLLQQIAEHLRSIRYMLIFFTVLAILGLIAGGCNLLLAVLSY